MTSSVHESFPNVPAEKDDAPHGAVILYVRALFDPDKDQSDRDRKLGYIFDEKSPGYGYQHVGSTTGYHDLEWMPDYGIEPFETGAAYVVGFENYTYYEEVVYSRAEFCGWFALAARQLVDQIPTLRFEMHELQSRYYEPGPCAEEVRRKLDGELPWAYGPVGKRATPEDIAAWLAFHRSGYAALYV